ncbi:MAG TPA: ferritin-like domain-containing protein [Pedococcus sp.]|nr:ferritin-like domain-containing protein [Pedococcus sp.]
MAEETVRTRADLVSLLTTAAEVEHSLMVQYLFAALTMKQGTDEGLTEEQLIRVTHWEKLVLAVARQEMEHLGLVANLLTAIGAGPHLTRPNFPYATSLYGHVMELTPFSKATVHRFACFEKPQDGGDDLVSCPPTPGPEVPGPVSVVALYEAIRTGFVTLAEKQEPLFLVGAEHQLGGKALGTDFPRVGAMGGGYDVFMSTVSDLGTALAAIDLIIEQGEAAEVAGDEGHYVAFRTILTEYDALQAEDPAFQPARWVVDNPTTTAGHGDSTLTDPLAVAVAELFDASYRTMLRFLLRLLMSTDESAQESSALTAVGFFPMMTMVIRPLAEVLTSLPAHDPDDGGRGGPPFAVDGSVGFLPHREAAWSVLSQELTDLAARAREVSRMPHAPARLAFIARTIELVGQRFTAQVAGVTP